MPNLIPTYRPSLGTEELKAVAGVFASRHLGLGEVTRQFEHELSDFLGAKHVIGVNHGTAALHLALDALELQPTAEVIVPSLTFVATVQAILMAGGTPVFCEVRQETLNLDLEDALSRVTSRTRAILPVHFGGLPCDMEPLLAAAAQRGLSVIEDAAHAFGSCYQGRRLGSFGHFTCFSFDAIKNITCGEGGAVTTSDDALARMLRRRRRLGIETNQQPTGDGEPAWQYHVLTRGFRYHLPDLNAAIGLEQLKKFSVFQARRREIVAAYDAAFAGLSGIHRLAHDLPQTCPWAYVLRVPHGRREAFRDHLQRCGVRTLIQFIPNHLQPAFASYRVELPTTEKLFKEIVSLPLHLELTASDVNQVIEAVDSFARGRPAKATLSKARGTGSWQRRLTTTSA